MPLLLFCRIGNCFPIRQKASGGWQRCADENVAQKCDAHLAVNNAEALLNKMHSLYFLNLTLQKGKIYDLLDVQK